MPGFARFWKYCHGFARFYTVSKVLPRFCPVLPGFGSIATVLPGFARFWQYCHGFATVLPGFGSIATVLPGFYTVLGILATVALSVATVWNRVERCPYLKQPCRTVILSVETV
jgi:hypothetical protein